MMKNALSFVVILALVGCVFAFPAEESANARADPQSRDANAARGQADPKGAAAKPAQGQAGTDPMQDLISMPFRIFSYVPKAIDGVANSFLSGMDSVNKRQSN